jgi:hypothetical protein
MAYENQFTATGPAMSGSGQPGAAFSNRSNSGTVFTYGVNVIASGCGVLGVGGLAVDRAPYEIPTVFHAGVAGLSNDLGVWAKGGNTGVHAEIWHAPNDTSQAGSGIAIYAHCDRPSERPIYAVHDAGGPAITGYSKGGPGGRFASDNAAQLRLPPSVPGLPSTGEVGDVVVINTGNKDQRKAEMWLCTEINKNKHPVWREVMLGRTVSV